MDPLTALGLGSNILQVINFGVQLVGFTRDVIESGDTYDNYRLHRISSDLLSVIANLSQAGSSDNEVPDASTEKPTQALRDLARECKIEAQAMVTKLASSGASKHDNGRVSRRSALKAAASAIWNKSEIDSMASRLDNYRNQLGLRMLDVINARSIKQDTSIVEILSLTKSINSSCRSVAALLKTGDGAVETILSDKELPEADRLIDTLSVTYRDCKIASAARDLGTMPRYHVLSTEISFAEIGQKIVDSLHFPLFNSRQQMVDNPFEDTFSWISGKQGVGNVQWDDFPGWLRTGTGCYWINGKAGSGKSILMKHIANHPVVTENLQLWANGDELLMGSFFFWRTGMDPLQKSHEGLLRSLLLQVLDRRRDLITVCFPNLCRTLSCMKRFHVELNISCDEIKTAFSLLITHRLPKTKLFLVIDGLDGCQNDCQNLVDCVLKAVQSPQIKILVSSRPLPLMVQAFKSSPGLEIHYLTLNDIKHYAERNLRHDDTLITIEKLHPGTSDQLINSIVSKAFGVFLWVKIVVRDLLYGLAHHESPEALRRSVDQLPTDLVELYDHMFTSMPLAYREEASRMMQLLRRSQEVQFEYPMTVLQLAFAQMKEVVGGQHIPQILLSRDAEDAHCNLVEGWLRSRCCGLLEVQRSYWRLDDQRRYIGFLHGTVLDYLKRDEIKAQLLLWDLTSTEIDSILFTSCIMEVRQYMERPRITCSSMPQSHNTSTAGHFRYLSPSTATRILHAIALCPIPSTSNQERYDAAIEEMVQKFLTLPEAEREQVSQLALAKAMHPSLRLLHVTSHDILQGIWMYAALHGVGFNSPTISRLIFRDKQSSSLALFNNLIHLSHPLSDTTTTRTIAGARQLLAAGADPNESCLFFESIERINATEEIKAALRLSPNQDGSLIPWIFWLSCKSEASPIITQDYLSYMKILECMIFAGANLHGFLGSADPRVRVSVYSVVEQCIEAIPDTSKEARELRSQVQGTVYSVLSSSRPTNDVKKWRKMSKSLKLALRSMKRKNSPNQP